MKTLLSVLVLLAMGTAWGRIPSLYPVLTPTGKAHLAFRSTWTGTVLGHERTCRGWEIPFSGGAYDIDASTIRCGRYEIFYRTRNRISGYDPDSADPTFTDATISRRSQPKRPCPFSGTTITGDFFPSPDSPSGAFASGYVQTLSGGASCRWLTAPIIPPSIVLRRVEGPVHCTRTLKQRRWHCE
jgi:hypothetical protein